MVNDIKDILEGLITNINTSVNSTLSKKVNLTYNYSVEEVLTNEPTHNSLNLSWLGANKYSSYTSGQGLSYQNNILIVISSNKAYEIALELISIFANKQIIIDGLDKRVYTIEVNRFYSLPTLDKNKLNIILDCVYIK